MSLAEIFALGAGGVPVGMLLASIVWAVSYVINKYRALFSM